MIETIKGTENFEFTVSQKDGYDTAMAGVNFFLTGGPGTGKSFLTRAIIKDLKNKGKSVLVMAPTGIAAVNVEGMTIHRALGLKRGEVIKDGKDIRGKKCPLLDNADVVLIDEISMVRMDLFEYVAKCIRVSEKRGCKKIQFIVVGDFFQLPPVIQPETRELLERYYKTPVGRGYCFQSEEWTGFNFKTVILRESVRQKEEAFIKALNQLRIGDVSCISYLNRLSCTDERFPYLVSTNEMADEINKNKVEELEQIYKCSPRIFHMEQEGTVRQSDLIIPEEIGLYPGARIMMVVNDPMGRYQNGTCGIISRLYKNDYVDVDLDNGNKNVRIKPYTWNVTQSVAEEDGSLRQEECGSYTQLPLKLAYAITIHKSQGQTYDDVNIDPDCWEAAQLYVALSRVKKPEGVHLMRPVKKSSVIVDPKVKEFYSAFSIESMKDSKDIKTDRLQFKTAEKKGIKKENTPVSSYKEGRQTRAGRPSPFTEGTKRIRVGAGSADYIQEICKKQAEEGGKIRLIPDELDICISDALDSNLNFSGVTFMVVPLELEGIFRREIKKYDERRI